ncbi:MAG: TonB-dependent receptor [Acinetobacter sp.]
MILNVSKPAFQASQLTNSILLILSGVFINPALTFAQEHTNEITEKSVLPSKLEDIAQLEEVIVTTRRREEKAQNVPTPMTILSAKTLENQRLSRIDDLQQALPSINVAFMNPRQSSVAVRGLGNNPASDGLESSVGIYLDNVYLGRPGMAVFDLLDIAQLELLRGPQGTLFGKNTTAGLLNISTKAPTFYADNSAEFSFGENSYFQTKAALSNALTDTLAGRLSVYKTTQDGYIKNTYNGEKLNNTDREGVRAQLLWKPNDQFNLRWIADYNKEDDSQGTVVNYNLGPTFNSAVYGGNYNRYVDNLKAAGGEVSQYYYKDKKIASDTGQNMYVEQGGSSAEANWTLDSGIKLTSISAYRFWNFTPRNSDWMTVDAVRKGGTSVKDDQFSQEFRIASAGNQHIDWVAGLYYFYQKLKNNTFTVYGNDADAYYLYQNMALRSLITSGLSSVLNNRTTFTYGKVDTNSSAAFGQGVWHVTPKLDLTAGLRVTYEDKKASVNRITPIGGKDISSLSTLEQSALKNQIGAYNSGNLSIHDLSYSGLLTSSYRINAKTLAYAIYSHGEKSGGFNLAVSSAVAAGANSLKVAPEKADNYEIGLKQNLFNNKLQLNTNLFWTNVKDYQTTSYEYVGSSLVSVLANAGEVRSRGAEIDATFQPARQFTVNFNGSLNDTTYTKYQNAPSPSSVSIPTGTAMQDLSGQRVYGVPKWVANLNFRYDLQEKYNWQPYITGGYSWRDWSYGTIDNDKNGIIKSYGLLNVSIGARHSLGNDDIELSLWVKNLTNRVYVTNVWNSSNGILTASLGQPRTIGATVKLHF